MRVCKFQESFLIAAPQPWRYGAWPRTRAATTAALWAVSWLTQGSGWSYAGWTDAIGDWGPSSRLPDVLAYGAGDHPYGHNSGLTLWMVMLPCLRGSRLGLVSIVSFI